MSAYLILINPHWDWPKASLSGSFTRVSFVFNSLPHMHFWWHVNVLIKREKNWVSWGWNSLGTVTNSLWVIELNVYETMKWNFPLRMGVSSEFHFIVYDMAVLETTKWNPRPIAFETTKWNPEMHMHARRSHMDKHDTTTHPRPIAFAATAAKIAGSVVLRVSAQSSFNSLQWQYYLTVKCL
jgi:hypothetical protein